jgi:hypothetical protein
VLVCQSFYDLGRQDGQSWLEYSGLGERADKPIAVAKATMPSICSEDFALSSFLAPVGSISTTEFQQFHVRTG